MRMGESLRTSDQGVQQVKSEFTDLGWNAIEVPQPGDVGTDLYVQLFDERRHALRLVLGVQVRSGTSHFGSPVRDDSGETIGWWCSDSRDHFDYWSTHALPHLIVLRDLEKRVSYWVHVESGEIEPAGEGAKILVRRDRVISADQVDDLAKVAASQKAAPLLEGLAISAGIDDLPPSRRLRYALIAPRLAAPPRAADYDEPICAEEAIALLAAGRFRDLARCAEAHDEVPDPEQTGDDASWLWQFAAALWGWAASDSVERLRLVVESAPDDQSRAASGVLLACALRREEQLDASTAVLDGLADRDSMHPVDRGWVLVQRARNKIEVGDVDGAHADAVEAQSGFAGDHVDITVSALRASAAWSLYYAAWMKRFDAGDFASGQAEEQERYKGLLIAFDTAVSWWRSQEVSGALSTEQDESFRSWKQDDPIDEIVYGSFGEDRLFAAELNADLTAEQEAWRSIAERRGLRLLMRASKGDDEVIELVEGLDLLRRCGRKKPLGDAIGHLLRVGPADALAKFMGGLPRTGWSSTTISANFEALALAGHFLDEEPASGMLLSCSRYAGGGTADLPRCDLSPPGLIMAALEGAAGLMDAAPEALHGRVARDLAELPSNAEPAYSMRIGSVLSQLEWEHVELPDRERLRLLAERDNPQSVAAVLGWFSANGDEPAQVRLRCLAAGGDLDAVSALANLSDLSDAQADDLLGALSERARSVLADANGGTYGGDRDWAVGSLVRACATFPDRADWDDVFALLADPSVATETKRVLCATAYEFADRLPDEVRQRFMSRGEGVAQLRPIYRGDGEIGAIHSLLLHALGDLSVGEAETSLVGHAIGSHLERRDAARLALALGSPTADVVLAMLAQDRHFAVRSRAVHCIGRRVVSAENRLLDGVALGIARGMSTSLHLSLLNGLRAGDPPRRPVARELAERLMTHPSARVRRRAFAVGSDAPQN